MLGTSSCLEWCTLVPPPSLVKTLFYFEEKKTKQNKTVSLEPNFLHIFPLCWLSNNRESVYVTNRKEATKYNVTSLCFDPFAV